MGVFLFDMYLTAILFLFSKEEINEKFDDDDDYQDV